MANKNLTDLTARTATADTDLIHVSSGGVDYKQTKANFCKFSETTYTGSNAITLDPAHTNASVSNFSIFKKGSNCVIRFQVGSIDLASGQTYIGTIRSGCRPPFSAFAAAFIGGSGDVGTLCRILINSSGDTYIYAPNAASGTTIRASVSYPIPD